MIAIKIGIVEKKPRNSTLPNTATGQRTRNVMDRASGHAVTDNAAGGRRRACQLKADQRNDRPMAAGGRTTLIQSVPHL